MLGAVLEFFDEGFDFIRFDPDSFRNFLPVHNQKTFKAA
jgi:hypothetical protein